MRLTSLAALVCLSGALAAGEIPAGLPTVEQPFALGGAVTMDLCAGWYRILPGPADKIIVSWQVPEGRPEVSLRVRGSAADLDVRERQEDLKVWIQVPASCHLKVRLSAGDLRIGAIEGDKYLTVRAGEVRVEVPDPNAYGFVEASVKAGEIAASAFQVNKGGLFRSFEWSGPGKFQLKARLLAGELTLR